MVEISFETWEEFDKAIPSLVGMVQAIGEGEGK